MSICQKRLSWKLAFQKRKILFQLSKNLRFYLNLIDKVANLSSSKERENKDHSGLEDSRAVEKPVKYKATSLL